MRGETNQTLTMSDQPIFVHEAFHPTVEILYVAAPSGGWAEIGPVVPGLPLDDLRQHAHVFRVLSQ